MQRMVGNIPDEWFRPEGTEANASLPAAEQETTPVQRVQPEPAAEPTTTVVAEPRTRSTGRRGRILAVAAIIAALIGGLLLGQIVRERSASAPASGGSSSSAATAGGVEPYSGKTRQVVPTQVAASCTAKPATDSLGQPVTYEPEQAVDGKLDTAWRCDGAAAGQSLTFTLPAGTELVRVAVYNGYGKTDPKSGESMYGQYRRVTSATWQLPDGSWFTQKFADNGAGLQQVEMPKTAIKGDITFTIVSTTPPGWANVPTRDAVLISEVQFFAATP